jgi:phage tail-like protein
VTATRGDETFRYVNLERQWPGCVLDRVEVEDGVLRLSPLPSGPSALAAGTGDASALAGPSRIGVSRDGTVYIADPAGHRILRLDPCGDRAEPLPCVRGPGSGLGELSEPHGVAIGPRDTLYVADTGNARVQMFDLRTGQVRGVIGARRPWDAPAPSDDEGRLRLPWDLALDAAGNLYVAEPAGTDVLGDAHRGRIQKFDAHGRVVPGFWRTMRDGPAPPASPASVVIVQSAGEGEALLVIDGAPARAVVYSLAGEVDDAATAAWEAIGRLIVQPAAATLAGGSLYVADAATSRVLVFSARGTFLGLARDYSAEATGLAIDREGRLLAQSRSGGVARFAMTDSFAESGSVVAGPFTHEPGPEHWFRLHLTAEALPEHALVQLFTFTSDSKAGGAPAAPVEPDGTLAANADGHDAPAPTPAGRWRALPPGVLTGLVLNEPMTYLWVGMVLQGNGRATPRLSQLRLDDDASRWLHHLPALYSRDEDTRTFLDRALALFQDELEGIESQLEGLVRATDPRAAPDRRATPWLEWLSGWLAFPLSESWTEAERRDALAAAFSLEATRGTAESLRTLIRLYAGARVRITEPATTQRLWSLGRAGRLGLDTMLAPMDPHGTVLDTTAALDRTHLLEGADEGMPPLAAVANRFCVEAYAADFPTEAARRELVRVIEDEKPAHTTYHLCLVEPAMRVGAQARVGLDAIVGGHAGVRFGGSGQALTDQSVLTAPGGATRTARVGRRLLNISVAHA